MNSIISIIGSGVISAVTSLLLYLLNKKNKILIFEINKKILLENSKVTNNAGTGHEGMCENNYVKFINNNYYVKKNIRIYCKFNLTKNMFSWIKFLKIFNLKKVITNTSHVSFFFLKKNIKLKKIFNNLKIFNKSIKFTNNIFKLKKIFPLLIKKKKIKKKYSITFYKNGFDINYEFLSKKIFYFLSKIKFINLYLSYKIILIKNIKNFFLIKIFKNKIREIISNYVFVCAGGSSLTILKKYNKKISKNYFELPINGSWLITENYNFIKKHNIKVYSETIKNNPPMSIPHLDIRTIFNEKKIFFGPFAGLTFKILMSNKNYILKNLNLKFFLKFFFFSISNYSIVKYLLKENLKTKNRKIKNLLSFTKNKKFFYYKKAGKRLQILKNNKKKLKLIFGTKIIFNKNKNFAVLLGASPGASISSYIAKKIISKWFNFKKKIFFKNNNKKSKIFNYFIFERN